MNTAVLSPASGQVSRAAAVQPENARGLAALLLAASVAALAVVADQLIETWMDDHLLLAWVAMWAVVFGGSLLLTGSIRRMSARVVAGLDRWAADHAQARAAARLQARQAALAQAEPALEAVVHRIAARSLFYI
ncbi:MAG: hypothetical protein RLZZ555_1425 [Pseudomonadota bacterium]|jgi:hypothetical protein